MKRIPRRNTRRPNIFKPIDLARVLSQSSFLGDVFDGFDDGGLVFEVNLESELTA
jgi:hypothetical protein